MEASSAETGWIRERIGDAGPRNGALPVSFNLRFAGQQFDEESGLHYNHHRYYDPYLTVGYAEADPLGLAAGWNRFSYVDGDPLGAVDPQGLLTDSVTQTCRRNPKFCREIDLIRPPAPIKPPESIESRSRGKSDPVELPRVNPGRDCNGNCKPCPPGVRWFVPRPGHGHENGYWHEIRYMDQNPKTASAFQIELAKD